MRIIFISLGLLTSLLLTSTCSDLDDPPEKLLFSKSKILRLVNKERKSGGYCGETFYQAAKDLKWNKELEQVAIMHSKDMFNRIYFDHASPEGKKVQDRVEVVDYSWIYLGENLAYGAITEVEVVQEWMSSPGHCRNILNPNFTEMGVGVTGLYWTQVLAAPMK